jgi:uncharacterized protein
LSGQSIPQPVIGPVRPKERIEVIDILRGWAIFGMLVVNMSLDLGWDFLFEERWTGTADLVVVHLVSIFAWSKFWTLFSFLFGLGFALQLRRAEPRGSRLFPRYARRLVVLLLIGVVQYLLTSWGLILVQYALLGLLLFVFRNRSRRTILVAALICLLIPVVQGIAVSATRELRQADSQAAQQVAREDAQRKAETRVQNEHTLQVHSQGNIREITELHARQFAQRYTSLDTYLWMLGGRFPLFLLGLYAGRRRIFENIPGNVLLIRKVLWWGLGVGLVGTALSEIIYNFSTPAWPFLTRQLAEIWHVATPALSLSYAAAITLLVGKQAWKRRLAPLAAVGRIPLTNYFLLSLIYVGIFYSYGLGLWGKVGPLVGVTLAVLIFPVLVLLSMWWMKRFRFGPAEWLWRTLTYGKLQPMRVSQPAA